MMGWVGYRIGEYKRVFKCPCGFFSHIDFSVCVQCGYDNSGNAIPAVAVLMPSVPRGWIGRLFGDGTKWELKDNPQ